MLAVIQCIIICLPGCYPKTKRSRYIELWEDNIKMDVQEVGGGGGVVGTGWSWLRIGTGGGHL
jgi:hypothetical protein